MTVMFNEEWYDFLVSNGIATEDEIRLVFSINGFNNDSLEDILFVRTGYRNFEAAHVEFLEDI